MWLLALAVFLGLAYVGSAIVGAGLRISRAIEAFTTFLQRLSTQREREHEKEYADRD